MKKYLCLLAMAAAACKDDPVAATPDAALDPRCELLAERCDPYEDTPGTGHDCHQLGHANNVAMCVSRMSECLAACPEVAKDGGTDAGEHDAGPPDPICQLLGSRCHPYDDHDGGIGNQCHGLGHANVAATCAARQTECLAACPPTDGGAADAATDGPPPG